MKRKLFAHEMREITNQIQDSDRLEIQARNKHYAKKLIGKYIARNAKKGYHTAILPIKAKYSRSTIATELEAYGYKTEATKGSNIRVNW